MALAGRSSDRVMTKSGNKKRRAKIIESARKVFGARPQEIATPGGEGRSSYRLIYPDRSVIATLRPNFRRTHLEAFVLQKLAEHCSDVPEVLGVDGEIMFQSDVGKNRLNLAIAEADSETRAHLAEDAVAAIFRVQSAGRAADLHNALPHLGQNRDWIENLVYSVDALADFSGGHSDDMDKPALCEALDFGGAQFLKWDCRSGNAAIGDDGVLRWFDFEYSGVRHGAEDFAWLIGDEAWPLLPEQMETLVSGCFDPACGHKKDDFLDYLALYTAFHCVQRLKLIVKRARAKGWISKRRVRRYDDAGVHPEFAIQICRVGRYFADRNRSTSPLARDFEDAQHVFRGVLLDGLRQASQAPEISAISS